MVLSLLMVAVIAIGLASRRGYVPFPAVLGNYPGDALWAWVVLLCVAWLRPAVTRGRLMAWSLLIAFAIEFLQLYQAPWMQAVRANKLAYLVLGNGFDPWICWPMSWESVWALWWTGSGRGGSVALPEMA